MLRMIKDSHILMEVVLTIQELQRWTQMAQFGKEQLFMTARSMVKNNTKRMLTIFKLMAKLKRTKPIQDFLMHQHLFNLIPQLRMLVMIKNSHTLMVVETTILVPPRWIQMVQFGKEQPFTTVKSMVKNNIRRMLTNFKLMVKLKRTKPIQDFLMHQHLFNLILQLSMLVMIKNFHTLMVVETTIQVPLKWTLMEVFGKELLSMMVKFTEKNSIKKMPMTFKLMAKLKRTKLTLDSHTHQPLFNLKHQEVYLFLILVSHIFQESTTIQEPQLWTQMLLFGKEKLSMMERFMERKIIKKMLMISKHTERNKRLLLTPDSHMPQHWFKLTKWVDHQSQVLCLYQTLVFHT
jgi:hypothetical protein